jgi:hypothetical protein
MVVRSEAVMARRRDIVGGRKRKKRCWKWEVAREYNNSLQLAC